MGAAKTGIFSAWIDTMPGSPPTLHVRAKWEVNSGGYKATMVKANPQGFNPNIIIFDVKLIPPKEPATTVMTTVEAEPYRESPPEHMYTDATFRDGAETVTIPVRRTS